MPADRPRVRFAPSPTGYLHVGGARAVLFNWLFARQTGGEFLLRIEDTDAERNQPELTDDILRSIEWLGLGWDGEVVHQSDHRARHLEVAEQLVASGHAFWSAWQPRHEAGAPPQRRADDRDAGLGPGDGRALRFRVPDDGGTTAFTDLVRGEVAVAHDDIEDFVLVRANGTPMFLLANAVDDADMGITHVLRGEEHVNGTPKYLLIQRAIGVERPTFAHLPILVDEQRKKLSKRKHSVAVSDYRARGILPEAMVNYLALLGWGPPDGVEVRPLSEIVKLFRLEDVNPAPAFFDVRKLEAINGEWVRRLDLQDFTGRAEVWLAADSARAALRSLAPLAQERVRVLEQLPAHFDWTEAPADDPASWDKAMKLPQAADLLDGIATRWAGLATWDAAGLKREFDELADAAGLAKAKVQAPIRVAVTGRTVGLPLFELCEHLGRDEVLRRIGEARAKL